MNDYHNLLLISWSESINCLLYFKSIFCKSMDHLGSIWHTTKLFVSQTHLPIISLEKKSSPNSICIHALWSSIFGNPSSQLTRFKFMSSFHLNPVIPLLVLNVTLSQISSDTLFSTKIYWNKYSYSSFDWIVMRVAPML